MGTQKPGFFASYFATARKNWQKTRFLGFWVVRVSTLRHFDYAQCAASLSAPLRSTTGVFSRVPIGVNNRLEALRNLVFT